MKTNLSSQITLTRIPLRYYRPENAFEHSVLTRLEKIPTNIYESAEEGSFAIAKEIATQIRKKQDIGKPFVIALPGGRSPLSVYKELIRMHKEEKLSFRNVIAFVEYEFYPLANPSAGNLARLKEELFDQVDIDPANIYRAERKPLEATELERDKVGLSRSTDVRIDESHTLAVLNPDTHAVITVK